MQRFYVKLNPREANALVKLALRERRHPSDQGALIIRLALESEGFLSIAPAKARKGAVPEMENGD